ncbi:cobalamin-dependent protein, partial [Chloroflexota bacterium]
MKLELILPKRRDEKMMGRAPCPPLGLGVVAALTPDDVDVSLTDERISVIDFQKDIDLVGIGALTTTAPRAYAIADTLRARGIKVVLGGVHPSILPGEASHHADAVVIGEAEGIWPKVIDDFKAGRLENFYTHEEPPSLIGWPSARRDLFAKSGYFLKTVMSTSRG